MLRATIHTMNRHHLFDSRFVFDLIQKVMYCVIRRGPRGFSDPVASCCQFRSSKIRGTEREFARSKKGTSPPGTSHRRKPTEQWNDFDLTLRQHCMQNMSIRKRQPDLKISLAILDFDRDNSTEPTTRETDDLFSC